MAWVVENVAARVVINKRQKTLKGHPSCRSSPDAAQSRRSRPARQRRPESGASGLPVPERRLKTLLISAAATGRKTAMPASRRRWRAPSGLISPRPQRPVSVFLWPMPAGRPHYAHGCRGEVVKRVTVHRVYRHKLAFQMGRQFADHQPVLRQRAGDVITIGRAFSRFLHQK